MIYFETSRLSPDACAVLGLSRGCGSTAGPPWSYGVSREAGTAGESVGWRQEGPPWEVRRSKGLRGEYRVGTRDPRGQESGVGGGCHHLPGSPPSFRNWEPPGRSTGLPDRERTRPRAWQTPEPGCPGTTPHPRRPLLRQPHPLVRSRGDCAGEQRPVLEPCRRPVGCDARWWPCTRAPSSPCLHSARHRPTPALGILPESFWNSRVLSCT